MRQRPFDPDCPGLGDVGALVVAEGRPAAGTESHHGRHEQAEHGNRHVAEELPARARGRVSRCRGRGRGARGRAEVEHGHGVAPGVGVERQVRRRRSARATATPTTRAASSQGSRAMVRCREAVRTSAEASTAPRSAGPVAGLRSGSKLLASAGTDAARCAGSTAPGAVGGCWEGRSSPPRVLALPLRAAMPTARSGALRGPGRSCVVVSAVVAPDCGGAAAGEVVTRAACCRTATGVGEGDGAARRIGAGDPAGSAERDAEGDGLGVALVLSLSRSSSSL